MHYVDGSAYEYLLREPIPNVLNAGWLSAGHAYTRGVVEDSVASKLAVLMVSTGKVDVHVNRMRGHHPCALSRECPTPVRMAAGNGWIHPLASELWIPDGDRVWAAPSMILHYVQDHGYQPPFAFMDALRNLRLDEPFQAQDVYLRMVAGRF